MMHVLETLIMKFKVYSCCTLNCEQVFLETNTVLGAFGKNGVYKCEIISH